MNLETYMHTVISSKPDDWTVILCDGAENGPSYRAGLVGWPDAGGNQVLDVRSHSNVAVLRKDLAISLAWGLESNADFQESWANDFPDPRASSSLLDFFYNNSLVYRDLYITVDGGRCHLPLPERRIVVGTSGQSRHTVPKFKADLFYLVNALSGTGDYGDYFHRAGIEPIDVTWPE